MAMEINAGDLPEGWEITRLDKISEIIMGQSPPSKSYNKEGKGLPFFQGKAEFGAISPTAVKYCTEPTKIAKPNDILLTVRAPVGPTNLANIECCIGRGLAAIRSNKEKIDYRYLYYYFKGIENELSKEGQGSTFTAISGKEVRAIQIPVPPLPNQRKIIFKLDAFFEHYDKLMKEHNLEQSRAGKIMQIAISKLMPNPEEELPEGWNAIELEKIANFRRGPFGSAIKKNMFVKEGYKVYEQKNVIYNDFESGNYFINQEKFDELESFKVEVGDILISCSGTVGKIAIVPEKVKKGVINQALLKITPDSKKVERVYLKHFFESNNFQSMFIDNTRGSAMSNVSSTAVLKKIKVPLPPINEQKKLIMRLELTLGQTREINEELTRKKRLLALLPNAVLRKAFAGELLN